MNFIKKYFEDKKYIRKRKTQLVACEICRTLYKIDRKLPAQCRIHNIFILKENKKKINILIDLERPGLIIGKHGSTLELVKNDIKSCFKKEVNIILQENDLFETYYMSFYNGEED